MKKRRARQNDQVIVTTKSNTHGQRVFVLEADPQVEIHMPAGTVIRFRRRPYLSGMPGPNGAKAPGGFAPKKVQISYMRTVVFNVKGELKAAVRPVLNWRGRRSLLMFVRQEERAKVLSVP